jgi:hypothetical protein
MPATKPTTKKKAAQSKKGPGRPRKVPKSALLDGPSMPDLLQSTQHGIRVLLIDPPESPGLQLILRESQALDAIVVDSNQILTAHGLPPVMNRSCIAGSIILDEARRRGVFPVVTKTEDTPNEVLTPDGKAITSAVLDSNGDRLS